MYFNIIGICEYPFIHNNKMFENKLTDFLLIKKMHRIYIIVYNYLDYMKIQNMYCKNFKNIEYEYR